VSSPQGEAEGALALVAFAAATASCAARAQLPEQRRFRNQTVANGPMWAPRSPNWSRRR